MIDLDKFPTNPTAQYMMSMISPIYDRSYVGKWIFQVIGLAMQVPNDMIKGFVDEEFPETATWSLPNWEYVYGIETNPDLPIDIRRKRILEVKDYTRPMNPARIASLMTNLTGRPAYVRENTAVYEYEVCIHPGESEAVLDDIREKIKGVQQPKRVVIVFETPTSIRIRADPKKAKYKFPITSEALLAGTYPRPSTIGYVERSELDAKPEKAMQAYLYPVTGTMPDVATPGKVQRETVNAAVGEESQNYPYPAADTLPDTAIVGSHGRPDMQTSVKEDVYRVEYKVCGRKRL